MTDYPFLTDDRRNGDTWEISDGKRLVNVHPATDCHSAHCVLHKPSNHHMRDWLLHWRWDRGIFERICEHGVGHPDPDQFDYWESHGEDWQSVHGCDGCCSEGCPIPSATSVLQQIADEAITAAKIADEAKREFRLKLLSKKIDYAVGMNFKIVLDEWETAQVAAMLRDA